MVACALHLLWGGTMLATDRVPGSAPTWAVAVFPSGAEFNLEIAADPASRARGYMDREHVGEREGMLFIFDRADHHGIYMKNCLVPLDVIWLDDALNVVFVARGLEPCPPGEACPTTIPAARARYVLEVAGGTLAREGLSAGDRLVVLAEPPLP